MNSAEATIAEIRERLRLAGDSATLLMLVADEGELDFVRQVLADLLRSSDIEVVDMGPSGSRVGPAAWADGSRGGQGDRARAFVTAFAGASRLEAQAFAQLVNSERGSLRDLGGPVLLLVSRDTERLLRIAAHDFVTWVAKTYELPELRQLLELAERSGHPDYKLTMDMGSQSLPPPIRFLHVSDLHLRGDGAGSFDRDRVLRGLLKFVEHSQSDPLHLLFVTGDLGASGKQPQYAPVCALLEKLCGATGVPLDHTFVVPGNHDVDRERGRWALRSLTDLDMADEFFERASAREIHRGKFAGYEGGMRALFGPERNLGLEAGADAVEFTSINGKQLAVASFNSAWFSQDDGDRGKLWLGEASVQRALDRIAERQPELAIALFHHPLEYLHEDDRAAVERVLERGFDLVLRGHLHRSRAQTLATSRGGYVELAAPAAYQGSQWGNGCFIGEIWPGLRRMLRVRPLRYAAGPDPWVLDTTVFPDAADDGYRATFALPVKNRGPRAPAEPMRRAAREVARKIGREGSAPALQGAVGDYTRGGGGGGGGDADERWVANALAESPALRRRVGKHAGVLQLITELSGQEQPRIDVHNQGDFGELLRQSARHLTAVASAVGGGLDSMPEAELFVAYAAAVAEVSAHRIVLSPHHDLGEFTIVVRSGTADDIIEFRCTENPNVVPVPAWLQTNPSDLRFAGAAVAVPDTREVTVRTHHFGTPVSRAVTVVTFGLVAWGPKEKSRRKR